MFSFYGKPWPASRTGLESFREREAEVVILANHIFPATQYGFVFSIGVRGHNDDDVIRLSIMIKMTMTMAMAMAYQDH